MVKRKGIILLLLLFISIFTEAQGLFNNGALIVIQNNALLKIDGDANGNFTQMSGTSGSIDVDGTIMVEGNFTNGGTNNIFLPNDANGWVILNGAGSSTQTIGGSHLTVFEKLEVDHTTQGATCGITDNAVTGELKLTNGPLVLNSNTFIVDNSTTSSVSRTNGYVVSETYDNSSSTAAATPQNTCTSFLQWNIATASAGNTFIMPFGTSGGNYIPFYASITTAGTGSGNLEVSTYHTSTTNYPYPGYPDNITNMNGATGGDNSANCVDRFWSVNYLNYATPPAATLTFYYDATNDLNGLTATDLQAQSWSSSAWNSPVGVGNAPNYVNAVTGVNYSREWTLSNKNNPLPVELLSFNAVCDGEKVNLNWSTASETNCDYFVVERSTDAANWDYVLSKPGAGTSNIYHYYTAEDNDPLPGVSYYRLKQVDYDGQFETYGPVTAGCETENTSFSIINTSFNEMHNEISVTYTVPEDCNVKLFLFDDLGQKITSLNKKSVAGLNYATFSLSRSLVIGVYFITIEGADKIKSQKIFVH